LTRSDNQQSGTEKKCLRTSGPKAIMTSLPPPLQTLMPPLFSSRLSRDSVVKLVLKKRGDLDLDQCRWPTHHNLFFDSISQKETWHG